MLLTKFISELVDSGFNTAVLITGELNSTNKTMGRWSTQYLGNCPQPCYTLGVVIQ